MSRSIVWRIARSAPLRKTLEAKQQTTRYTYDALSRVTTITYHDGSTVAYTYDQRGHLYRRLSYAYDPNGNRSSQTNGATATSLSYAANSNRVTQINGAQSTPITIDAMAVSPIIA